MKTSISSREKQILYLIAFERTTQEIATQLNVSFETVKSHRKNLLRKLDVRNIAGLVRRGMELELIC